jgi:hypothetical protein
MSVNLVEQSLEFSWKIFFYQHANLSLWSDFFANLSLQSSHISVAATQGSIT